MRLVIASFVALGALLASCSSKVTPSTKGTTTSSGKYSEDLAVWRQTEMQKQDTSKNRPAQAIDGKGKQTQYVEARFAVNESLDAVLDSIDRINLNNGLVDGYTIQIYSGTKREEALNIKKQLSNSLPELDAEVQYSQPNFRVRAGKYYDRLQAQRDYIAIRRYFPNAIVIPERIPIAR
jgi:hypothetical protein